MVFDDKIVFCLTYSELENLYLYDLTTEEEDSVDSALEIVKKHLNDEDFDLDDDEIESILKEHTNDLTIYLNRNSDICPDCGGNLEYFTSESKCPKCGEGILMPIESANFD